MTTPPAGSRADRASAPASTYTRFEAGRPLWVAGLEWPGETGLAGHSDGDVAAHAACDALLAAAGSVTSARSFGTTDPRWSGASGVDMLREAARRVRRAGYAIGNVSVQVIGNRPAIGTRRDEAERCSRRRSGRRCRWPRRPRDGLGLTGRGEGLAAIASALIVPGPVRRVPRTTRAVTAAAGPYP